MTINGFAKIDSSLINLNSDKNKPKNTTEIKNVVQEQQQISSDSLSSTKLKSSKIIPANAVPLIKIEKKGSSTDNENYAKFTKLYDKVDKGILEKLSGDEVNASIEILNNDNLRK